MITLITGGARSGKTRYALTNGGSNDSNDSGIYIATAILCDDEMRDRAAAHRAERGDRWRTIEEPYELGRCLSDVAGSIVIDCLTLWLSNWLLQDESRVQEQIETLCSALRCTRSHVVAITNEVGSSIVPDNPLARRFRDYSGYMNQRVAAVADRVYLMICGMPLQVK